MVSDLAPVDLILQRLGRLWRHAGNQRYGVEPEPRLLLIKQGSRKDGEPSYGVNELVYPRALLLRTHQVLGSMDSLDIPGRIDDLVETVYSAKPDHFGEWNSPIRVADQDLENDITAQRHKASTLLVKPPEIESIMEQMALQLDEEDPESPRKLQAATRDTLPNIQVILCYVQNNRDYLDSELNQEIDLSRPPRREEIRSLLANEVSLTRPQVIRHAIRAGRPDFWKETGALCRHHLVRVGPDGNSVDSGYGLRIDRELGIVFEKNNGGEA